MDRHLSSAWLGFGYAKALIFGEYAVMYGAPGLVVGLTAKLECRLDEVRILSGGASHSDLLCAPHGGGTRSLKDVLGLLPELFSGPFFDARLSICDEAFFDETGTKYGIGSSSAAVVALVDAYLQLCREYGHDVPDASRRLGIAVEAHRWLQGGLGSGIDVLASAMGGALWAHHCQDSPHIERISVENLPEMAFFTLHRRAPTSRYIEAAERVRNTTEARRILDEMAQKYWSLSAFARTGRKENFLETLSELPTLLNVWGSCIDMPVLPSEFEALSDCAASCHVVLKTAGAGGGDLLIACALDSADIRRFEQRIERVLPLTRLHVSIAPERPCPGDDVFRGAGV